MDILWHNNIPVDKTFMCHTIPKMKRAKRAGRPAFDKGKARSETLRIRLTPAEKAAIEAQSDNPSEWARQRLLEGLLVAS